MTPSPFITRRNQGKTLSALNHPYTLLRSIAKPLTYTISILTMAFVYCTIPLMSERCTEKHVNQPSTPAPAFTQPPQPSTRSIYQQP